MIYYAVRTDLPNYVKIGYSGSGNVNARITALRTMRSTGDPKEVRLLAVHHGDLRTEAAVHARFRHLKAPMLIGARFSFELYERTPELRFWITNVEYWYGERWAAA